MRRRDDSTEKAIATLILLVLVGLCAGGLALWDRATCERREERPVERTQCHTFEGHTTCETRMETESVCVERSWP